MVPKIPISGVVTPLVDVPVLLRVIFGSVPAALLLATLPVKPAPRSEAWLTWPSL